MSDFKAYKSFLINPGASSSDFKEEIKGHLTTQGWQVHSEDTTVPSNLVLRMTPPVAETIGNANGYEVAQLEFGNIYLNVSGQLVPKTTKPYKFALTFNAGYTDQQYGATNFSIDAGYDNTAGNHSVFAVNYNPIVDGSYQPADDGRGTKGRENLANLIYTTLQSTTLDFWKDHDYTLVGTPDSGNYNWVIYGTPKAGNPNAGKTPVQLGSDKIVFSVIEGSYAAEGLSKWSSSGRSTTALDYGTGFIYYLSVNARTFQIATKTTVSFYGPVGATWGDNALAAAQTPPGLIPSELVTFDSSTYVNDPNAYCTIAAQGTHYFGYMVGGSPASANGIPYNYQYLRDGLSGSAPYGVLLNLANTLGVAADISILNSPSSVARSDASPGGIGSRYIAQINDFIGLSVVSLGSSPRVYNVTSAGSFASGMVPSVPMPDVYVFTKAAVNESLHLTRILNGATTLTTGLGAGQAATSLTVGDASRFPTAGSVILGTEIMAYTGKSGNTLTGLTRALYNTASAAHSAGDTVYTGLWFVKINGGALCAGPVKPS